MQHVRVSIDKVQNTQYATFSFHLQSRKAGTHHARFVWFLPVLPQLLQLELVLQLLLQIVLKALLLCSAGTPETDNRHFKIRHKIEGVPENWRYCDRRQEQ